MIGVLAALALQSCAPLEQLDVFGEVGFDTPVTADMVGGVLRGYCPDLHASCRMRDRSGVAYEVTQGRIVSKSLGGWSGRLPFGLSRGYRRPAEGLEASGIDDAAIEIVIAERPSHNRLSVAVCGRALTLTIPVNEAGHARSVALAPSEHP